MFSLTHLFYREDPREFAIKKFKPDREGDTHHYVGISQSACREIAVIILCNLFVFFFFCLFNTMLVM